MPVTASAVSMTAAIIEARSRRNDAGGWAERVVTRSLSRNGDSSNRQRFGTTQ
jgi:hypothetical protein